MKKIRKILTEKEVMEQLRRGKFSLPPLSFRLLQRQPDPGGNRRIDAFIEASWRNSTARFAVEIKSISTPKAFEDGINVLKSSSL
ncbi:MAG: hypothetical protein ACMUIS_09970, partial [bacterium]